MAWTDRWRDGLVINGGVIDKWVTDTMDGKWMVDVSKERGEWKVDGRGR